MPVASRPAVLARGVYAGVVRVVFHQHHIAHIGATRDGAFQQVMAEDGLCGEALVEHGMNGLDVQQALAGKGALAEQVLVEV